MKKANMLILFGIALLLAVPFQTVAQKENSPLKGKKVLYVWGGWEGHDPDKCRDIFVPWLRSEGAEVSVYNTLDCYTDSVLMSTVDLVIQCWTMGTITEKQSEGLRKAVLRGVGMAGWHGGMGDSFREDVTYQYMVGGQWVAHPGGPIDYDVHIIDHNDPVTQGLKPAFHMKSEQYYMHVDPNVKVLATTKYSKDHDPWIEGAVIPVVWKKSYGQGRVFYSSLGHVAPDFQVHEALEIMKRGIRWASLSLTEGPEKWMSPVYKY